MAFAKELFVSIEEKGSESEYIQASKNIDEVPIETGETKKVGIYKLDRVVSIKNKSTLIVK